MKSEHVDTLEDEYNALGEKYSKCASNIIMTDGTYEYIANYIARKNIFSQGDRILSAGCGNGYLDEILSKKYRDLNLVRFAFDLSESMVNNAKKLNPDITHEVAALPKTPYNEKDFDVILLSEVLEHCAEPLGSLLELRRVLKDKGYLIVTIPNGDWIGFNRYLENRSSFQPADDYFYTFSEVQNLFRKSGFRVYDYAGWAGVIPKRKSKNPFRFIPNLFLSITNRFLLKFHPDIHRKQKRILFLLKKDDYLFNHDC
jgi:SAM-dependent methyltransferase